MPLLHMPGVAITVFSAQSCNVAIEGCVPGRTLLRTGSLAISRTMGGESRGRPSSSRHMTDARSKRKPSTWYSSTHLHAHIKRRLI